MTLVAVELQLSAYYRASISISCSNYKLVPPTSFPDLCPLPFLLPKTSCWILRKMHLANVFARQHSANVTFSHAQFKGECCLNLPVFAVETCREILSRLMESAQVRCQTGFWVRERVFECEIEWECERVAEWEFALHLFYFLSTFLFLSLWGELLGGALNSAVQSHTLSQAQGVPRTIHCLQDALHARRGTHYGCDFELCCCWFSIS